MPAMLSECTFLYCRLQASPSGPRERAHPAISQSQHRDPGEGAWRYIIQSLHFANGKGMAQIRKEISLSTYTTGFNPKDSSVY